MRSKRLAMKEQNLMDKKGAGKLENYNVMKNVSTHSMINAPDGDRPGKFFFTNYFFYTMY